MTRLLPFAPWLGLALVLGWLLLRDSPPDPQIALLEQTVARHERVIANQRRDLGRKTDSAAAWEAAHVRDSLALIAERVRSSAALATARAAESRAGEAVAAAGATLDATLSNFPPSPLADSAVVQLGRERSARDVLDGALRDQIGSLSRLLQVTDSTLATTERALAAERARADAAAKLAQLLTVTLDEQKKVTELWKAEACTGACPWIHRAEGALPFGILLWLLR